MEEREVLKNLQVSGLAPSLPVWLALWLCSPRTGSGVATLCMVYIFIHSPILPRPRSRWHGSWRDSRAESCPLSVSPKCWSCSVGRLLETVDHKPKRGVSTSGVLPGGVEERNLYEPNVCCLCWHYQSVLRYELYKVCTVM